MRGAAPVLVALLVVCAGCGGPETTSRRNDPAGAAGTGVAVPTELFDVRDAETEGRAYPTAPPPERTFPTFEEKLPGTEKRECVEMRAGTPAAPGARVRSGEFAAAAMYLHEDPGRPSAKIPWESLHLHEEYFANAGDVWTLTSRVQTSLSEPTEIVTFREGELSGAGGRSFYASGTPLPGEGPWRMIATSGPDWVCFDLKPS